MRPRTDRAAALRREPPARAARRLDRRRRPSRVRPFAPLEDRPGGFGDGCGRLWRHSLIARRGDLRQPLIVILPRERPGQHERSDRHRVIRHVEGPEANVAVPDVDEVHDAERRAEAIDQVSGRPAPCKAERGDARQVAGTRARAGHAIQPPEHEQRDECEATEDHPRVHAERHAECRAGIVREREAHGVANDAMRYVARREHALRQQLRHQIGDDDATCRTPEETRARARRSERGRQTRSPPSTADVAPTGVSTRRSASCNTAARSSCQSTHASSTAPRLTAMSATLKVGQRAAPKPTSRKSTTPISERSRSSRLPNAPAHTMASARVRGASPRVVARYSRPRITSATSVSAVKIHRECAPRLSPNAAPGLYTSVSRIQLPSTSCWMRCGASSRSANPFVTTSITITKAKTGQKSVLLLRLRIFLLLLALNAETGVRERIEPLEGDFLPAVVALAECLGRAIETTQRLVDVPEEPPLLTCEQERLFALHRIRALIRHVERIAAEIAVGLLRGAAERLIVVAELLEHALPLFHQPLLEVLELLLGHRLQLPCLRGRAV